MQVIQFSPVTAGWQVTLCDLSSSSSSNNSTSIYSISTTLLLLLLLLLVLQVQQISATVALITVGSSLLRLTY